MTLTRKTEQLISHEWIKYKKQGGGINPFLRTNASSSLQIEFLIGTE